MKLLRKSISVILAMLMILSCCSAALAAEETYDHLPQIYVTGFQSANIYYENDPDKKPLLAPVDTKRLLGNLLNIDEYVLEAVKTNEADVLYNCVYSFLWDSFGMLAMGPDGSNSEGVVVEPTVLSYEGDGKYVFYYDSRLNPLDIVGDLKDYIEQVKADSGYDKVELVGSSYGADVVTAYLSVYADDLDDLDSVLLCVPSVGGVAFFGELISGNFDVDPVALENFVFDLADINNDSTLLGILNSTGLLDLFFDALLVPALREAIYKAFYDIAKDLISTIPAIWVTIQDQHFESALVSMYGENWDDPDHEYAQLIAGAKEYHENVMMKSEEILLAAKEKVHLSVVCKYGSAPMPIGDDAVHMEDGLATLEVSSFGATCALYGETLDADYTQALYPEYNFVDVNNRIDASTCVLPFNTWIIKGLGHSQKNEDYWNLLNQIVYRDLDVFADEEYPQFLQVSEEDAERLIPLQEEAISANPFLSFVEKILAPVRFILELLREFLAGKINGNINL